MSILRDGYRVPFSNSLPPLSCTPVSFLTYRAGLPRAPALWQEVVAMLAKGALEIALDPGPGFYSRLFLVEKASGGWRPMIDLSHLNEFVQFTPFKTETVVSVLLSVREGDFLASLDLKDAYFQIPIRPSSRKLLRFTSEGTVYQFRALCFALSSAPQVFIRVFAAVSAWAHSHGIRLLRYLDDWLVLASLEREAKQAVQSLLSLCRTLGFVINVKKSDLVPSQTAKYLGMTIHTEAGTVFRLAEIPVGGGELLYYDLSPGSALAGGPGSPGIARAPGPSWSPSDVLSARASQGALVPGDGTSLSSRALASGSETGSVLVDGEGPSFDRVSIRNTCSGSAAVFGRVLFGVRRSPPRSTRVRSVVGHIKLLHINLLEMKTLSLALRAFREVVIAHNLTVMCDNSTVVACVN